MSETADAATAAADELFDSIRREVCEETGASAASLGAPMLLGFARRVENHRPVMAFVVPCAASAREIVAERYARAADRFESRALFALPIAALRDGGDALDAALADAAARQPDGAGAGARWRMPGCHEGVLELWRRYRLRAHGDGRAEAPTATAPVDAGGQATAIPANN